MEDCSHQLNVYKSPFGWKQKLTGSSSETESEDQAVGREQQMSPCYELPRKEQQPSVKLKIP